MTPKVLNLYAGIGGNRQLWTNHNITAVEIDPSIAAVYNSFFPTDALIIADAHDYLINNYFKFDFIWSSPPCQTHSQFRQNINVKKGQSLPLYPDMRLYQEIIFLQHNFAGMWVVENVKPYYAPLVNPSFKLERHLWWNNFEVLLKEFKKPDINLIKRGQIKDLEKIHNFDLSKFKLKNKRQVLRNCVLGSVGKYIYDCMIEAKSNREKKLESR